jgi:hypothetical protein
MHRHARSWLAGLTAAVLTLTPALAAEKAPAASHKEAGKAKAAAAKPAAAKPAAAKAGAKAAPAKAAGKTVQAGFTGKDVKSALGKDRWLLKVGAKPLPQAVRKSIVRGKVIPENAQAQPVAALMMAQLPSYKGFGWVRAGTDLVLVSSTSKQVADIVPDVFE